MVLKFRLISNEQDNFIRDFEILANQTFFQFHMAIQENLHFDKSQIASFFICSSSWEKEQEITLFELSDEESAKVLTMENVLIGDYMKHIHDKMIYVFDVFNERLLFIEFVEKTTPDTHKHYPFCSHETGNAPQQLLMDQLFSIKDFSNGAVLDLNEYSEEFADPDELDELGYSPEPFDEEIPDD